MKHDPEQNSKHNITAALAPAQSPVPATTPAIDPQTLESLRKLQRADAFFHKLTPDQQNTLLHWITEEEDLGTVAARVSAAPPNGFGVQVHMTSLRRFRARWRALTTIMNTEEILDSITDMELNADLTQTARIQKAINHMLHEKAFDLARTHPGSDTLKTVLTSIEKLAALDYKKQKLQLEREKLLRGPGGANGPVRHGLPASRHHTVDLNILPPSQNNSPRTIPVPDVKRVSDNAPALQIENSQ